LGAFPVDGPTGAQRAGGNIQLHLSTWRIELGSGACYRARVDAIRPSYIVALVVVAAVISVLVGRFRDWRRR